MCIRDRYYALRDYGVDGQIGREATPKEYISRLTEVFTEVRRVLRSDGTLWLNISDTYAGKGNQGSYVDAKNPKGRNGQAVALNYKVEGCKPKDMIGIPWMLAFSLRDSGWYLRNDTIWMKENPMPESVKDRCARCYEHIFLFSKSKKYFFDYKAISEPCLLYTSSIETLLISLCLKIMAILITVIPVSYTHLDVYKRQERHLSKADGNIAGKNMTA